MTAPFVSTSARRRRLAASAFVLLGAGACGQGPAAPPHGRPPATVTVFAAMTRDVPVYLDQIGRVVASETVTVRPRVSGPITSVRFDDGADVAAKAPLFEIDPRPYQARLDEVAARVRSAEAAALEIAAARDTARERIATAKSRVTEAQAQVTAAHATTEQVKSDVAAADADAARARADVQRFENAPAAVSPMDLDRMRAEARSAVARHDAARRREAATVALVVQAEAAAQTADAGVREAESMLAEAEAKLTAAAATTDSARASVESARLDVEFCSIAAPIGGRAGRRLIDVGNVVQGGLSELLSIQRIDPIHVEFSISERDLTAVQASRAKAAAAKRALEAEIRLPGDGGEARKGPLAFLDNQVSGGTGTVTLRATHGERRRALLAGPPRVGAAGARRDPGRRPDSGRRAPGDRARARWSSSSCPTPRRRPARSCSDSATATSSSSPPASPRAIA